MKNKYIKFLIIINGTLLPVILLFALYNITKDVFRKTEENIYKEQGIIVGEELEVAKKEGFALQGLQYDTPSKVYNSDNYYLPISLMTYEEKKRVNEMAASANDINPGFLKQVNIIFLDKNYKVIRSLLNKKGSILDIKFQGEYYYRTSGEIDETAKYIGYLISLDDTNKDGKINSLDHHDLYISDLDGGNLKRITNKLIIESFEFISSNTKILITYATPLNTREEHKEVGFAIYDIYKEKFTDLNSLNKELEKLEKIIIN